MPEFDINLAVRTGGRIITLAQIGSHLVSVVVVGALYHLIEPSAYGLLGMVLPVFVLFRQVIGWGLNVAAIQRSELSTGDSSNLFWLNLTLGIAGAVFMATTAPLLAWFNDEPSLAAITVALAGSLIVVSLATQHQALLDRRMRLGANAMAALAAQVAGGVVAIAAALAHWHVWALVVQQYVELLSLTLIVWWLEPWRPGRMQRGRGLRSMAAFGGYITGGSLMLTLMTNLDKVMVGYLLGKEALGLYGQAFALMSRPARAVTLPAGGAMLSALTRSAGDPSRYAALLLGAFRFTAVTLFPVAVGVFLVAEQALPLFAGDKWRAAAPLLVALSLTIPMLGFIYLSGSALAARGRADRYFFGTTVLACGLFQALAAGYWQGREFGGSAAPSSASPGATRWGCCFAACRIWRSC